jgi:predicted nuclease with TOPRIM domain
MKEKLTQRLKSLQAEFEAGQNLLADYESKERSLRETLLRISGAIIVLEEMLADPVEEVKSQEKQTIDIHAETQPQGELAPAGEGT